MNLRTNSSAVLALLLAGTISALSQSADQQLGFAQHLQRSGDAPFALLEFKRFIYLHPKDQRAASAHRDVADLYFGYFKDVDSGKAALAQLLKDFPKSKEAPGAQETLNLLSLYRGGAIRLSCSITWRALGWHVAEMPREPLPSCLPSPPSRPIRNWLRSPF